MTRRALALVLLLAPAAAAQEVAAVATPSATEVSIGQPFTVEVKATGPAGTSFSFQTSVTGGPVELQATSAAPAGTFGMRYAATAVGLDPQVPPLKVAYRLPDGRSGSVQTAAVPLRLVSLLPKDPQQHQLADVRPPVDLSVGPAFWVAVGLLGASLGVLAAWLWSRRRRKVEPVVEAAPVRVLSPAEEALQAIDELGRSELLAREDLRGFYIALADVAKRYLERRLGAPVLEMTSSEAVVFVQQHDTARAVAPLLRELTQAADLVKFARAGSAQEAARRHLQAARGLVEHVEEGFAPRTQGPTEP